MELELVPESDPTALAASAALSLVLLKDGSPFAGLAVAAERGSGKARTRTFATSDASGRVTFQLDQPGPWLFAATELREKGSEWESDFTTLTAVVSPTSHQGWRPGWESNPAAPRSSGAQRVCSPRGAPAPETGPRERPSTDCSRSRTAQGMRVSGNSRRSMSVRIASGLPARPLRSSRSARLGEEGARLAPRRWGYYCPSSSGR